jgi:hypothetical protein
VTPDRETATAFIGALAGGIGIEMTWQLLNDDKRSARFARDYHADLDRIWRELCFQNERGVGIFVMVNAGDGHGRRAEHVVALRSLFIDDDQGRLAPGDVALTPLAPSFAVRSKRGFHHYWLLEPTQPLNAFTSAQSALATHFGTDAAVKDLPRVMRVPGFFHVKDPTNPFMVQMVPGTLRRHTISEVLAAYPAPPIAAREPPPLFARRRRHHAAGEGVRDATLAAFRRLRLVRWAMEHPQDVSREAWRGIATNIAAAVLDDEHLHSAGAELFRDISELDPIRYSPADCDKTFRDALKSARGFGPMTYATLEAAGVPAEVCAGAQIARAPVGVARALALRVRSSV